MDLEQMIKWNTACGGVAFAFLLLLAVLALFEAYDSSRDIKKLKQTIDELKKGESKWNG